MLAKRPSPGPWFVAGTAVLFCLAWQALVVYGNCNGNWTAVFHSGRDFPPPPALKASTYQHPGSGYDAQFYRYAAHDPLLRLGYQNYMDEPRLRYQRILIPALASLAGSRTDAAYLALILLTTGAGVWFCSALAIGWQAPAWSGLLFLTLPATIASIDRALVDGALCAAFAAFLYFHQRGRTAAMALTCLLAALIRDTGLLLAAAGIAAAWLTRPKRQWRHMLLFCLAVIPALLWAAYVASRTPLGNGMGIVSRPVWGLFVRLFETRSMPEWSPAVTRLIQTLDVLAMLGLLVSIGLGIRAALRHWPSAPSIAALQFAALAMVLAAPRHLEEPFGWARPISPLLLWILLDALRRRAWAEWLAPIAVSLAVALGPATSVFHAIGALLAPQGP
jgi:hypothetical protein